MFVKTIIFFKTSYHVIIKSFCNPSFLRLISSFQWSPPWFLHRRTFLASLTRPLLIWRKQTMFSRRERSESDVPVQFAAISISFTCTNRLYNFTSAAMPANALTIVGSTHSESVQNGKQKMEARNAYCCHGVHLFRQIVVHFQADSICHVPDMYRWEQRQSCPYSCNISGSASIKSCK